MTNSTLVLALLTPFILVFGYAIWHEYRRFNKEGRSTYGLSYDPETDSTHVTSLGENEESYVPDSDTETTPPSDTIS